MCTFEWLFKQGKSRGSRRLIARPVRPGFPRLCAFGTPQQWVNFGVAAPLCGAPVRIIEDLLPRVKIVPADIVEVVFDVRDNCSRHSMVCAEN